MGLQARSSTDPSVSPVAPGSDLTPGGVQRRATACHWGPSSEPSIGPCRAASGPPQEGPRWHGLGSGQARVTSSTEGPGSGSAVPVAEGSGLAWLTGTAVSLGSTVS